MRIGFGIVECSCRKIVGLRLKRPGCRWTLKSANDMPAIKCALANMRRVDFKDWKVGMSKAARKTKLGYAHSRINACPIAHSAAFCRKQIELPSERTELMKVTWYGQASFGIESRSGIRIVTDPYDPEKAGFKPFPDAADIVIKSSSNDDFHDNDHLVPKKPGACVIDALEVARRGGSATSHEIGFRAIEAMEHDLHPSGHPDQNAMYRFEVDGIDIGHMGDMGNDFSEDQLAFFSGVHVLLSHAGGFPVISLEELKRIVDRVRPNMVIPMHFRTLCFKPRMMHFITDFLELFGEDEIDFAFGCSAELESQDLPEPTRSLVLDYY